MAAEAPSISRIFASLRSVVRFRRFELDPVKRRLARAANVDDLRADRPAPAAAGRVRLHRRRAPRTSITLAANSDAYRRIRFRPRVLRDVRDGRPLDHLARPAAAASARARADRLHAHRRSRRGARGRARRGASAGCPYTLSTLSTRSIEEVGGGQRRAASGSRSTCGATAAWCRRWSSAPRAPATRRWCSPSTRRCSATASATCATDFTLPPKIGLDTLLDGALHPGWTWDFVRARADPLRERGRARRRATAPTPCRSPTTSTRSSTPDCRGATSSGCARSGTGRS